MKIIKYKFLVKYKFFRKVQKFCTLPKNSYFAEILILYQKFVLYQKNSYFTEIFLLDGKFRTPDVQVLCFIFLDGVPFIYNNFWPNYQKLDKIQIFPDYWKQKAIFFAVPISIGNAKKQKNWNPLTSTSLSYSSLDGIQMIH